MTSLIAVICSGGQTGVDRGALDAARDVGVTIEGWCPVGGWAEDLPEAPGLQTDYPELRETPSPEPAQRTEWNVRDSDVTLIIDPVTDTKSSEVSPGTALTRELASSRSRPSRTLGKGDIEDTLEWLRNQGTELTVNIAGPRESEWPGAYEASYRILGDLLRLNARSQPSASA
ncbi:MAG: putative molybdenum carrier protein [Corynebacterium variabile]|uniref:putative molybdenum carrier protein n=1 Tax=Corynebacterium variabile TaxID=1727 RepID=UPI003F901F28